MQKAPLRGRDLSKGNQLMLHLHLTPARSSLALVLFTGATLWISFAAGCQANTIPTQTMTGGSAGQAAGGSSAAGGSTAGSAGAHLGAGGSAGLGGAHAGSSGSAGTSGAAGTSMGTGGGGTGGSAGMSMGTGGSAGMSMGTGGSAGSGGSMGCSSSCSPGMGCQAGQCVTIGTPRPLAPLSTSTATSHSPTLHWALPSHADGAQVQLCSDRALTSNCQTFTAMGSSGKPPMSLSAGVYFWRVAGALGGNVGTSFSPVWELLVGSANPPVDTSWGSNQDLNGDGLADMVLNNSSTSQVNVYLGTPMMGLTTAKTGQSLSTNPPIQVNGSLMNAGDVNGDGFPDLLVLTTDSSGSPILDLYLGGGSTGIQSTTPASTLSLGTMTSVTPFSSAGDVNGDGYADVLIGIQTSTGDASLYLGSASGLSAMPLLLKAPMGAMNFGVSVASAGDVNGDGYGDFLVGTTTAHAYLYLGSSSWSTMVSSPVQLTYSNPPMSNGFNPAVAGVGDINGDGYADMALSFSDLTTMKGAVVLYPGGANISVNSPPMQGPVLAPPGSDPADFGSVVSSGADVNGDGQADFLIGAASQNIAYLAFGNPNAFGALPISPTITFLNSSMVIANGFFGSSVALPGDSDGDGLADPVVAAGQQASYPFASESLKSEPQAFSTPSSGLPGVF